MDLADTIEPQPWMTARPTRQVMTALMAKGQIVRFVGGCVRDAILGRAVKDIDLATPDDPETVTALLNAAGITSIPTGIDHGTITAVAQNQRFEITTLRWDAETFGRRARVEFTDDWIADAERRDLTINAIYCDPDGTLYDPTGGRDDFGGRAHSASSVIPNPGSARITSEFCGFFAFSPGMAVPNMRPTRSKLARTWRQK